MIVDLDKYRHYLKQKAEIRELDIEASYVALEECLKILNINDLPELEEVKNKIRLTMKELKNGKSAC